MNTKQIQGLKSGATLFMKASGNAVTFVSARPSIGDPESTTVLALDSHGFEFGADSFDFSLTPVAS